MVATEGDSHKEAEEATEATRRVFEHRDCTGPNFIYKLKKTHKDIDVPKLRKVVLLW